MKVKCFILFSYHSYFMFQVKALTLCSGCLNMLITPITKPKSHLFANNKLIYMPVHETCSARVLALRSPPPLSALYYPDFNGLLTPPSIPLSSVPLHHISYSTISEHSYLYVRWPRMINYILPVLLSLQWKSTKKALNQVLSSLASGFSSFSTHTEKVIR